MISWARWSETAGSTEAMERMSVKEERVMNKSRMCLELWVGKVMCWVREKESRSLRKVVGKEVAGSSMCILKSPMIRSSEGEVARSSSRLVNSEAKSDCDEFGGR